MATQHGTVRYKTLLNSIAKDLDCMLSDLCQTLPDRANNHEPSRSLPHFRNTNSVNSSNQKWPRTLPRRGDLSELPVSRLANEGKRAKKNSSSLGPSNHTDGRTNHTRVLLLNSSAIKLPGLADKGGGQEFDKLPGLDGYQNNVPLENNKVSPNDNESWNSASKLDTTSDYGLPCEISILERLILTHSVWYLPGIFRTGAIHLLQGKEVGNFIIRQSSQPNTKAITVRLPPDKGPYIEHYLIEVIDGKLRLEGSDNHFTAIPMLVAHYCQCCDELPVQLTLPQVIANTNSKQQLSSLALLGQEFWMSPSADKRSSLGKSPKLIIPSPNSIPRPPMSTFGSPTSPTCSDFPARASPKPSSSHHTSSTSLASVSSRPANSPTSSETSPFRRASQRPTPPPRWYCSSPTQVNGTNVVTVNATTADTTPPTDSMASTAANFTVTTTVTFHVNQCTATLPIEVETPSEPQLEGNEMAPEPTLTTSTTASLTRSGRLPNGNYNPSPSPSIESPPGYHCSSLDDKISDYEDIWVCSPSPVPEQDKKVAPRTAPKPTKRPTEDGARQADRDELGCSDELQVIKALKEFGIPGGSPLTNNWEYSISTTNQTDQEKVRARNSQTNSENGNDEHKESVIVQNQMVRSKLGSFFVPVPKIPRVNAAYLVENPLCATVFDSEYPKSGIRHTTPERSQSRLSEHRHSDPNILWTQTQSKDSRTTPHGSVSEPHIGANDDARKPPHHRQAGRVKQPLSSSLTDLHSKTKILVEPGGGFINVGFRSSSSQLLAARGLGTSDAPDSDSCSVKTAKSDRSTLPRVQSKRSPHLPFPPRLQDLMADVSSSAATTLTKKPGKSFNESSWRLDSSWEWYSRHCGSLPSDSDSSSEDDFLIENLTDSEEAGLVQLRQKGSRFPVLFRPPGTYIANSFLNSSADTSNVIVTVEELLTQASPQLRVPEIKPLTTSNLLRVSAYDNLDSDDEESKGQNGRAAKIFPSGRTFVPSNGHIQGYGFQSPSKTSLSGEPIVVRPEKHKLARPPGENLKQRNVPSEAGSSATEFSEPWDSSRWERLLLEAADAKGRHTVTQVNNQQVAASTQEANIFKKNDLNNVLEHKKVELMDQSSLNGGGHSIMDDESRSVSTLTNDNDDLFTANFADSEEYFQKIPALPCLLSLRRKDRHLGKPIRDYVFKMAQDEKDKDDKKKSIFGQHIENFITCTLESRETNPHVVMRNIRQFMSGMANFLVNSGEGEFSNLVQEERGKLKPNEFLNLDTILEGVLHKIVVRPLKQHICHLFVKEYTLSGAVSMLSDSIKFARTRTPEQLGIKPDLTPPQGHTMEMIKHYLGKLQKAYSPLKKLENLLAAISIIYQSILQDRGGVHHSLGADDFLPMLTYALVHCGLIAAEVEAEYMWGLLHSSLLSGEGGYYLTTLSSAVHVLKHLQKCHADGTWPKRSDASGQKVALCLSELDGFMKVLIPNEQNGNIISKTVPVRPNMTAKDICKMVAHRLSVTNPQDYALYKLMNGEEIPLVDTACPWMVKMELVSAGMECAFAYKRIDAKIAWPVNFRKS